MVFYGMVWCWITGRVESVRKPCQTLRRLIDIVTKPWRVRALWPSLDVDVWTRGPIKLQTVTCRLCEDIFNTAQNLSRE